MFMTNKTHNWVVKVPNQKVTKQSECMYKPILNSVTFIFKYL